MSFLKNRTVVGVICILLSLLICFGLIMLYSTSAYEAQMKFHGDDMYYFRRQALISVGAIAVAIFISKWDYHLMIPFAGTLYLISVVLISINGIG